MGIFNWKSKKQIEALKAENAALKKIIDLMPGNVYWKNRQHEYLGCNKNQLITYNLVSEKEFIGKTLYDLVDEKYATPTMEVDEEIMTTGREKELEENGHDAKGNLFIYLTHKTPIYNEKGNITGMIGVSFDITERRKLEEQMRISFEKEKEDEIFSLRNIIALMPGTLYWKNREHKYLGCNKNELSVFKLKSENDFIGKNLYELTDVKYAEPVIKADEEIMANGLETITEEYGPSIINDTQAIYLTQKIPLRDKIGNIIGLLGISIDITERKKMEEELRIAKEKAEAADKVKTQFISVASHEMRNPLVGISSAVHFLKSGERNPEEIKKHYDVLENCSNHMLSLVTNILDFSQLEANKYQLSPAPANLHKLFEEVASVNFAIAKQKGLELIIDFEPTVPHNVIADSRALRQILINLTGNAIKFTQQGSVTIKAICTRYYDNESADFEISIEDTGSGIPADKIKTIFERFSQLDNAYNRSNSRYGTGIGLSITKQLLDLMSGYIEVESELGKGSIFKILINLPLQQNPMEISPWLPYASHVRVLFIDNTRRADVLSKYLESYNAVTTRNSVALSELGNAARLNQPFNIALIDDRLSSQNPFELLSDINKHHGISKLMPVLLVEKPTKQIKDEATKNGFFAIISRDALPTHFQTELTAAWEKWQDKYPDLQIRNTHSSTAVNTPVAPETNSESPKVKVLMIEDDPIVQMMQVLFLREAGCDVITANCAEDGLKLIDENQFQIVFTDIGLPDMNGFDVIKTIRQRTDHTAKLPIIALTGYSSTGEIQACKDAGANEIIVKPATEESFKEVIMRFNIF